MKRIFCWIWQLLSEDSGALDALVDSIGAVPWIRNLSVVSAGQYPICSKYDVLLGPYLFELRLDANEFLINRSLFFCIYCAI